MGPIKKVAAPFTPAQIEKSFRNICGDGFMSPHQVGPFMKDIGYERTTEQVAKYGQMIHDVFADKLSLELVTQYMMEVNDTEKLMEAYVRSCDENNDGFISEDEFKICLRTLAAHDPNFPNVSYENFKEEADTNKDGKISVEETIAWVHKTLESLQ